MPSRSNTPNRGVSAKKRRESCPNSENHTEGPRGYLQWHDWAERMGETHAQSRCPGCGFYLIWTPHSDAPARKHERD